MHQIRDIGTHSTLPLPSRYIAFNAKALVVDSNGEKAIGHE